MRGWRRGGRENVRIRSRRKVIVVGRDKEEEEI